MPFAIHLSCECDGNFDFHGLESWYLGTISPGRSNLSLPSLNGCWIEFENRFLALGTERSNDTVSVRLVYSYPGMNPRAFIAHGLYFMPFQFQFVLDFRLLVYR